MNLYTYLSNEGLSDSEGCSNNKGILAMSNSTVYFNRHQAFSTADKRCLKYFIVGDIKDIGHHLSKRVDARLRNIPREVTLMDVISKRFQLDSLGIDLVTCELAIEACCIWREELGVNVNSLLSSNFHKLFSVTIDDNLEYFVIHPSGAIAATTSLDVFERCSSYALLSVCKSLSSLDDGIETIHVEIPFSSESRND